MPPVHTLSFGSFIDYASIPRLGLNGQGKEIWVHGFFNLADIPILFL